MNSLPAKNAMKINGFFSHNSTTTSLIAAVFLTAFSTTFATSAFANRPAMEEQDEAAATPETKVQVEQTAEQSRPEAEAPSAVEVMMQQQAQQPRQIGDVVQLPAKEIQPGETLRIQLLDYPRRGMSMEIVQQQYGQPMATTEGVGQPPITRWTYGDRVVYFEYSTVLHVVAR